MWILLTLFLEMVIKRKSNSWDFPTFQSIFWNVIKTTRDRVKAKNAEYCDSDTPKEHNVLLFSLDSTESLRTSPENNLRFILSVYNWSKNSFGEIHVSQGLDWTFLSLSNNSLSSGFTRPRFSAFSRKKRFYFGRKIDSFLAKLGLSRLLNIGLVLFRLLLTFPRSGSKRAGNWSISCSHLDIMLCQ